MPRNRRSVDRQQKVQELTAAAEELFTSRGYAGTTMAAIAAAAGVAPNAVYWYFPSKDHLMVAVLDAKLDQALGEALSGPHTGIRQTIADGLKRLGDYPALGSLVHERSPHSPVVADFHNRLHQALRSALLAAVEREGSKGEEGELITDSIIAVVDADPNHGGPRRSREDVLAFVLDRLIRTKAGQT